MSTPFVPQNWKGLSLPEQLANIGSEVHRAFSWQKRGDDDASQHSWDRVFDLLDATIATGHDHTRLRELLRLREICCGFSIGMPSSIFSTDIEHYFFAFALFVAQHR